MDRAQRDHASVVSAGLFPITLADDKCQGHKLITGQHLGLCHTCDRLGAGPLTPEAHRATVGGEWGCRNWRAL